MIKQPIRNLRSAKNVPTRFCDVVVDGKQIYLEYKTDKKTLERIPWEDVVYPVDSVKKIAPTE